MVDGHDTLSVHERIDSSCDLLSNASRRRVIYALWKRGPTTVGDLADAVVAAGHADARDGALTSLVHVHLPKLDDSDVVEYDGPDDVVELGEGVERLEPFLSFVARREADFEPGHSFAAGGPDAVTDAGGD